MHKSVWWVRRDIDARPVPTILAVTKGADMFPPPDAELVREKQLTTVTVVNCFSRTNSASGGGNMSAPFVTARIVGTGLASISRRTHQTDLCMSPEGGGFRLHHG